MRAHIAMASILVAALGTPNAADSKPLVANHLKQIAIHAGPAAPRRDGGAVGIETLKLQYEGLSLPAPQSAAQWEHSYEFRPGKHARIDYNFEKPAPANPGSPYTGVRLQQGRVNSDTDWNESPSGAPGSPKRQEYAAPLDELPPGPPVLQPKSRADLPGAGTPFSGKYRVTGTTHKAPESAGYKAKFNASRLTHR